MSFASVEGFKFMGRRSVGLNSTFAGSSLLLVSLFALQAAQAAQAVRAESFTAPKLPAEWKETLGPGSAGSVAPTPEGLLLKSESKVCAFVAHDNSADGSDERPLIISAFVRTQDGADAPLSPGVHFYWDNENFCTLQITENRTLRCVWESGGVYGEQSASYVLRDLKTVRKPFASEAYLRLVLLSKSIVFYASTNGVHWFRLTDIERKGVTAKKGPSKIILGRAYSGTQWDKPANPGMANNIPGGGGKALLSALIREAAIGETSSGGAATPLELAKQDTWEQTLSTALAAGVPRKWSLLGPLSENHPNTKLFAPDLTDNWSVPLKTPEGKPIKLPEQPTWSRPDDDTDCYVDLPELMNHSTGLQWVKSEVDWPVSGEALLWFDSIDPILVSVNNVEVANELERNQWQRHILKDRHCVAVALNKGVNTIKVRMNQVKSDAGFYLRLDRNDPEFRIALLEKLLEFFPDTTLAPQAVEARLEIPRRYEEQLRFFQALSACDRAIVAFATDDRARLEAFDTKIRILEMLRDREGLVRAADAFLALKPTVGVDGTLHAIRAALRGEVLSGKAEAAQARAKKAVVNAPPGTIAFIWRSLAGAFENAGQAEPRLKALEELIASTAADNDDRADAAIEIAMERWGTELKRVAAERIESASIKDTCHAVERALAQLPGSKNPMAAAFATDAANDLKAGKFARALGGYWGALLLSACASDPDAAAHLALSKAYAVSTNDDDKKKFPDAASFKAHVLKQLAAEFGSVQWSGAWRFVGFSSEPAAKLSDDLGPEKNPAPTADYGPGHKWIDLDLGKTDDKANEFNSELGVDLTQWQGTPPCTNGYLARDVDVAENTDTVLRLSVCGPWRAWLDGKLIGENENVASYRFERDRVPLHLEKGKHRFLLRIDPPPSSAKFAFRARFSRESELGTSLLVQALCARQFPNAIAERKQELDQLFAVCEGKTHSAVWTTLADAIARLGNPEPPYINFQPLLNASDRLRTNGETGSMIQLLQQPLDDLLARGEFPGKDRLVWDLSTRLYEALASEGHALAADHVLGDAISRYPLIVDPFYNGLNFRAALRRDVGLPTGAAPYYERVVREAFATGSTQGTALAGLEWSAKCKPERLLFESTNDVVGTLDAVRRQLAAGGADDMERAMRNVADILQGSAGSQVRIDNSPFYTRLVGAREYVRALLASLPDDARAAYRTAVASASASRLKAASTSSDPGALEAVADSYYYTLAAQTARNQAGNLYFDRGQYAQAASMFQMLVREQPVEGGPSHALLLAKLARAQLRDGQEQAASRTVDRLKSEFAEASVTFGGEAITGAVLADRLRAALKAAPTPKGDSASASVATTTFMGSTRRNGTILGPTPEPAGLAWVRRLIPTSASSGATSIELAESLPHPQNYPVCDDKTLYVSALDSLCAFELSTGKSLWTRSWGAGGSPLRAPFTGFPISCPTLANGAVFMRALESQKSSLRCYAAVSGKLKWTTESVAELRDVVWLSDPAPAYNLAFAIYLERGDMNQHGLAALDAETGRLRWKTLLVTGATPIHTLNGNLLASVNLGPPAIDGGEVFVATGLSSVASVNAFSGEVKWITSHPKLSFADFHQYGYDGRVRIATTFCSGPLSPVIAGDSVLVAPKDGPGLLALDRQTGVVRWHNPIVNPRFIAGVSNENVLICEENLTALNADTGAIAWRHDLSGQSVYGQPLLSGGVVYLPTEKELRRIDAHTGLLLGAYAWDERIGALANLVVTQERIVGIGDSVIAALGPKGTPSPKLPMFDARELAAAGKLEQAVDIYSAIIAGNSENDADERFDALTQQLRLLQKLGKRDAALQSLAAFEKASSDYIVSPGGLWQVKKDVFAASIRARLGEKTPEDAPVVSALNGAIGQAWQIPADDARIFRPRDGLQDRVFVRAGDTLSCLRLSADRDLIWKSYIGTDATAVEAGPAALAVLTGRAIVVLDRATGQTLSELTPPIAGAAAQKKAARVKRGAGKAGPFTKFAIDDERVVALAGESLVAWDFRSGAELWRHHFDGNAQKPATLDAANGMAIFSYKQKDDSYLSFYDARSGHLMKTLPLGKQSEDLATEFSPDRQRMALRGSEALFCIDLIHTEPLWRKSLPRLDAVYTNPLAGQEQRSSPLRFDADAITYSGWEKRDRYGPLVLHRFDPSTGKELHATLSREYALAVGGEYFCVYPDRLTRESVPGKDVWKTPLTEAAPVSLQNIFVTGDRVNLLYLRAQDQIMLRSVDWKTGAIVNEQILPGAPLRTGYATMDLNLVQYGNVIAYNTREGVFALAAYGAPAADIAEKFRAELKSGSLSSERTIDRRTALFSFERPTLQALLAPPNVRLDSDPANWGSGEPLTLQAPLDYVPLGGSGEKWNGPADLSAKILPAWNRDGVILAVEVNDDVLVSPSPGLEATSGDSIRVFVGSQAQGQTWTDRGETVVVTLAWVNGQSLLTCEVGDTKTTGVVPQGHVSRLPNGKGYRYELLIPWALLRKDPAQRPGSQMQLSLGVAVYDDDGAGVKGALELGAGITAPCAGPQMLSQIELLDISQDKLERYRKVVALMPDSEEAYRFLELLVQSKSGPAAAAEGIRELEDFVRAHPSSPNAIPAAARLCFMYERAKDANAQAHLETVLRDAKAPPAVLKALTADEFRVWVYPDPKQPPKNIVFQFYSPIHGWCARAYWGNYRGAYGRDNTHDRMNMGPLPPPGVWTELRIPAALLNLHEDAIHSLTLGNYDGAVYYDHLSAIVNGKETFVFSGKTPDNVKTNRHPLHFVDEPKHDGVKSFVFDRARANDLTIEAEITTADNNSNLFSFATGPTLAPTQPTPEVLRKAAYIIPDTGEGLRLLQLVVNGYSDPATGNKQSIDELRAFLSANAGGPNDLAVVKLLYDFYCKTMTPVEAQAQCGEIMVECKLARDVRRAFYTGCAPVWSEWNVIGPFLATGDHRGMDNVLDPERGVNLGWTVASDFGNKKLAWQKISNKFIKDKKPNPDPYVDLRRFFVIPPRQQEKDTAGYFGYAYAKFNVPTRRHAMLYFGAQETISIWVNGKRVVDDRETTPRQDVEAFAIDLRPGENDVLIKVGALREKLGVIFRIADLDGRPFADVKNE